jgi:hypothetical protein
MKKKTLENFHAAGNALLKDKFKSDEAVVIMIARDKKMTHALKGKAEVVGYSLCQLALDDAGFFHLMKNAVEYIEKEKAEKVEKGTK